MIMEKIIEKYRNEFARISTMMLGELRLNGVELSKIEFTGTRERGCIWRSALNVTERTDGQ